jgi:hypothetical protein
MAADKWKTITAGNDWKQSVYSWGIGQIHETPNLHFDPPEQYRGIFFMAQDIDSKLWYHGSFQDGSLNLWFSHESYTADTGKEAARQYFIYHLSQQRDRASRELAKLDARIQALRDN